MCRHLGYLGPTVSLHELGYAPPHGLERQAYAAKLCRHGPLNADGFGFGWYPDGHREPVRYRRAAPIWADVSFAEVAHVTGGGCVLGAVRSATPGFPVEESGAQPFRAGHRLLSHNGLIEDFAGVETKLRELAAAALGGELPAVPDARAPLDSALLLALAAGAWRDGAGLGEGLAATVATVTALADARLNLLATDGSALAATTWGDSLYVRAVDGAVTLASEPLDDGPTWRAVPDGSLVVADTAGVRIDPLPRRRAGAPEPSVIVASSDPRPPAAPSGSEPSTAAPPGAAPPYTAPSGTATRDAASYHAAPGGEPTEQEVS